MCTNIASPPIKHAAPVHERSPPGDACRNPAENVMDLNSEHPWYRPGALAYSGKPFQRGLSHVEISSYRSTGKRRLRCIRAFGYTLHAEQCSSSRNLNDRHGRTAHGSLTPSQQRAATDGYDHSLVSDDDDRHTCHHDRRGHHPHLVPPRKQLDRNPCRSR